MPKDLDIRWYRNVIIWPRNEYGMYSAFVDGYGQVAADTLEGIRRLIRERLDRKGYGGSFVKD